MPDSPSAIAGAPSEACVTATPFDDGALYDALLGNFPYGRDFYVSLARQAGGPVLDLCCGTGRILLPCLQAGVDIEGVDSSPGMLAQLAAKAQAIGLAPRVQLGQMANFQLARRFALIFIPFNSFCHNLTTAEQIDTLTRCREHLLPGGQFAMDGFFPGLSYLSVRDGERVLEGETRDERTGVRYRGWDTRRFDRVRQIQHSLNEIEELDAKGRVVATHRSAHSARWTYLGEMELLLRVAGFARWQVDADFDGTPLTQETDGMVVRAFV